MSGGLHHQAARALRRFCLDCQGGSSSSVDKCEDIECMLFPVRNCTVHAPSDGVNPLRNIRRHCLLCAGSRVDVRRCDAKRSCPLWSFRFGVWPTTFKRVVSRIRSRKQILTLPGLQKE